jgi:DNA-directed RNA polymerase subunit RPC12/RpoP
MQCANCGQRSDWARRDSDWTSVTDHDRTIRGLYRCQRCGNSQHSR